MIAALKDKNVIVRRSSAEAFGYIKDTRALEPLIAALKDTDSQVRREVANTLGWMKDVRAVEPLIAASKDKVPDVRAKVMEALGEIGDPRAIESLIVFLKDKEEIVSVQAKNALKEMRSNAIESLIAALQSNDLHIQKGAAFVLADMSDDRVIGVLTSAFKNKKLPIVAGAHSFFIQQGIDGSESLLVEALNKYGDKKMAENFLNCGNQSLEKAGHKWANARGYTIITGYGGGPRWRQK